MGFEKCLIEHLVLSKKGNTGMLIICLNINNTMIVGNKVEIKQFKEEIKLHLKIKEEGRRMHSRKKNTRFFNIKII